MNPLKKIWWVCVVCVFFGFQVPDLRSYLVVHIIGWLWGIEGIEQNFLSRTPPHEHGLSRHYPCRLCFCGFQKWRTTLHEVKQCCGVKLSFSLKTTLFWVKVYVIMRFGNLLNPIASPGGWGGWVFLQLKPSSQELVHFRRDEQKLRWASRNSFSRCFDGRMFVAFSICFWRVSMQRHSSIFPAREGW